MCYCNTATIAIIHVAIIVAYTHHLPGRMRSACFATLYYERHPTRTIMHNDKTSEKFDEWSHNGKAEQMQKGHYKSVARMLASVKPEMQKSRFSFVDIGCGNGWVTRMVALQNQNCCRRSVGIDKSPGMIRRAEEHQDNAMAAAAATKIAYVCTDIESWSYRGGRFDYALAMESLYYAGSIRQALAKTYRLLRPGGRLLCGTDFYEENKATKRWAASMSITMHLLSEKQWRTEFESAGFKTRVRHLKDSNAKEAWKRDMGTLFVTGVRPAE